VVRHHVSLIRKILHTIYRQIGRRP
jgi:hypothetical protein